MHGWSAGEIVVVMLLVGTPIAVVAAWLRQLVIDARAARRLGRTAVEREVRRRPAPDTTAVEGRVVTREGEEIEVVTRRQFGCLGGPLMHLVPPFELELDDGTRRRVEIGDDPVVENLELLLPKARDASDVADAVLIPQHTGAPQSIVLLRGRVRVAGLLVAGERFAPPVGASAVLTILTAA